MKRETHAWISAKLASLAKNVSRGEDGEAQIFLRQALHDGYYICFHIISYYCVSQVFKESVLNDEDYIKIFRSPDHKGLKKCLSAEVIRKILDNNLHENFARLQDFRHLADYSPHSLDISWQEYASLFRETLSKIKKFNTLSEENKNSFAIYILFSKDR